MLDPIARRLIDNPLDRVGRRLAGLGLGANTITVMGFVIGTLAFPALAVGAYGLALGAIVLNRIGDGLDGAVARHVGGTDLGGYLDIVLDFIFYSGCIFFFAVGRPEHALPAAFLVFSFMGTGASFLAYAIMAAKRDLTTETRGTKAFYYAGGLAEGTETVIVLFLICLFPGAFEWICWIFGAMCWITTAGRIAQAVDAFRDARS